MRWWTNARLLLVQYCRRLATISPALGRHLRRICWYLKPIYHVYYLDYFPIMRCMLVTLHWCVGEQWISTGSKTSSGFMKKTHYARIEQWSRKYSIWNEFRFEYTLRYSSISHAFQSRMICWVTMATMLSLSFTYLETLFTDMHLYLYLVVPITDNRMHKSV